MPAPIDELENAINVVKDRSDTYGNGYNRIGNIMKGIFPNGITLNTAEDFARYQTFAFIVEKMSRYGNAFAHGIHHKDSAIDSIGYSAILASLTSEENDQ